MRGGPAHGTAPPLHGRFGAALGAAASLGAVVPLDDGRRALLLGAHYRMPLGLQG